MQQQYVSPFNQPNLRELTQSREAIIDLLINNLKIADVKEEENFTIATNRIKREVMITPVQMGQPRFVDHEYEQRLVSFEQQLIGMNRDHYVHTIAFPFDGDAELFYHQPDNGYSYGGKDHGLIFPESNHIAVYIDLPQLDPQAAITRATDLLRLTLEFKDKNNAVVAAWRLKIENVIDEKLEEKRKQLIQMFVP